MKFFSFKKVRRQRVVRVSKASPRSRALYMTHKKQARAFVGDRVHHFIQIYSNKHSVDFKPSGRIAIRNTKSRWGSCSSKGNLNFNWKIITLAPELADYIIVHELCHLKEFNHGDNFWKLVSMEMPEWKTYRVQLRETSL